MAGKKCTKGSTAVIVLSVGIVLFLASVIVLVVFPAIYKVQLHHQMSLVNGSLLFGLLKDIPLPIYQKLYFFNITNGEKFLSGKEKLRVVEVGPYVYKGRWLKESLSWHPNYTMTYRERKTYVFVPELSAGNESDRILSLNGPLLMAADYLKDENRWIKAAAGLLFAGFEEEVIVNKTVGELAYTGYTDDIIKYGKYIRRDLPYKNGIFSWLYGKNDTDDGTYTVFTGEDDVGKLSIIDNWNGTNRLPFWKNDTCNMINGSAGEVSPPLKEKQTELEFFQSFFCRSVRFTYSQDVRHFGMEGKRFSVTKDVFGNESVNAANACFDTKPYLPSGVQDISACQYGAPVFLSLPHFYLADPVYVQRVQGLKPNETLHTSYVDVMSTIGFSMETAIRLQLNLYMRPVSYLYPVINVPEGVFPIFWLEISVRMTQSLAEFVTTKLERPKTIAYSVVGAAIGLSAVLIVIGIVLLLTVKRTVKQEKKQEDDPLLGAQADVKRYSSVSEGKASPSETTEQDGSKHNSSEVWIKQDLHLPASSSQVPAVNSINNKNENADSSVLNS